jgi:hypothetical protein
MIFPMDLDECRSGSAAVANLSKLGLAPVYGAASARLRPGGVGFAPEYGLCPGNGGMEYPDNHPVLMAKRRGEGIP